MATGDEATLHQTLKTHFEEVFGWEPSEATMIANLLIPTLDKLFPGLLLEAECTMSLQFGVNTVSIDTKKGTSSSVNGRADFFLRDPKTKHVLLVVEAKKLGHSLDERDDEQVKSYMRARLPLIPYGLVVNASEPSRLFVWKDANIVKLDEANQPNLSSVPASIDKELAQAASRALMRVSPAYRDDAISQICRRALEASRAPSHSPREVVRALITRGASPRATVNVVTSPPKCGKSQALHDLAANLLDCPIVFVEQASNPERALDNAVADFELGGEFSDPPFIRFLKARASEKTPIYVLVDTSVATPELIDLVAFIAGTPDANAHVVIACSFQVTRNLFFREGFELRAPSSEAAAIFELGAFTNEELSTVYPGINLKLVETPFGRLLRWPGLRTAVRPGISLGDTLWSWFQDCPEPVNRAIVTLGADLAQTGTWSADRLPDSFAHNRSTELRALLDYGFVVELPRERSGLRDYGLTCIEVGLYALLCHVFEVAPRHERAAALDAIVARWKEGSSEQEMAAFAVILPTFLVDASGTPLDKIVRYMLSISLGAYALETMSRSQLFEEYARAVDSHVTSPLEMAIRGAPSEMLRKALVAFREKVGLMPDFDELERELGKTVRFFDGTRSEVLSAKLSAEQWQDESILRRLGRAALLDALYMLSIGNTSWLPVGVDQDTIRRIASAIVVVAAPHRAGFPIESRLPYLAELITRQFPEDLAMLLKSKSWSNERVSSDDSHVRRLAGLVVDAYQKGKWEPLSSCFTYPHVMSESLLDLLRGGLLEGGSDDNFANVFINSVQGCVGEWSPSIRERVIRRLLTLDRGIVGFVRYINDEPLRAIRDDHPDVFRRIREFVWEARDTRSILRLMHNLGVVDKSERDAGFWKLVAQLDTAALCVALSMPEFFHELFAVISMPIADVRAAGQADQASRGWELLLEAMCLLERKGENLVSDENWSHAVVPPGLDIGTMVRSALEFGGERTIRCNLARCKEYIRRRILDDVTQKRHRELDQTLRGALLNVHESRFNRIYVRVAVAAAREADAEYRMLVAQRLVLSGFDLWEVPLQDYTCPMLSRLLAEIVASLSVDERDAWIAWVQRNYHRLRALPNFRRYSLQELLRVDAINKEFLKLVFSRITEDVRYMLPLVDASLASFQEHALELAEGLLEIINQSSEGVSGFGARYPNELEHIKSFLPSSTETAAPKLGAGEVLEAFQKAADAVPRLPERLPAWSNGARARSMLAPLDGGFCTHTVESFRDSLTRRRS